NLQLYLDPRSNLSFSNAGLYDTKGVTLIQNGDFSQNVVVDGSSATGWSSVNIYCGGGSNNGAFVLDACPGVVPTISQELTGLIPGAIYTVTFDYEDPPGWFQYGYKCSGQTNTCDPVSAPEIESFGAFIDFGAGPQVYFEASKPSSPTWFRGVSFQFQAVGSTAELLFESQRFDDDVTYAVDNVSVTSVNTAAYTVDFGTTSVPL